MKKTFLITFVFLFSCLIGQEKSLIKPQVLEIIESSKSGNFDKVIENTYPKVFELMPKEQMLVMMKQMLNNPQFEISFQDINPDLKISEIKEIKGEKYAMVQYTNSMLMKFNDMDGIDPEMMLNLFKEQYKDGNVTYDKDSKTFSIRERSKMLAISDEFTNGEWKYLNIDKGSNVFLYKFISEDVIKEFEL